MLQAGPRLLGYKVEKSLALIKWFSLIRVYTARLDRKVTAHMYIIDIGTGFQC